METYIVNFLVGGGLWTALGFVAYYHVPVYRKMALPFVIPVLCVVFGAAAMGAHYDVGPALISGWWLYWLTTIVIAAGLLQLDRLGVTYAKRDQPAPPPARPLPPRSEGRWWSLDDGR